MSPALVVAFGLAGDAERNLREEPVQWTAEGRPVFLQELWPSREEIDSHLAKALSPADYARDFEMASRNPQWKALTAPKGALFPWDPASNALRRPPFAAVTEGSLLGRYCAYPLLVLGDDVTTDHISPASAIPSDSLVADYLVERGDSREDLNVFASRRGNWQVMMRAAFHNKTLRNLLAPGAPVAHTVHVPSGEVLPIWEAADRYAKAGDSVVVIAGERYGMGSSRDWAAKGQRLLGIRAVLARSFERIHRSNLIGMGILPVRLPAGMEDRVFIIQPGDRIEIDASVETVQVRGAVSVRIMRADGTVDAVTATAAIETGLEVELLRDGGVIPSILKKTLAADRDAAGSPVL
jgi:aconitate hydratase